MSKKPWEDKVSDEELEEVVDADFLDDEDEFEDYEEEDVTPSDEKRLVFLIFLRILLFLLLVVFALIVLLALHHLLLFQLYFVLCFLYFKCRWKQNCGI